MVLEELPLNDLILILAQDPANNLGDIVGQSLNYGVLGLVLVALITRKLVVGGELEDKKETIVKLEEKIEKLEEENKRLNSLIQDKIVPNTLEATIALEKVLEINNILIPLIAKLQDKS